MARFKNWPVLIIILLIGISAQSQKIFFEQLTTAGGLPSDYVNCVFEDSKSHLWIGTDKGACRYDGRQFQYFNNDNGLPTNFVSCFAEDPAGNIWIGTVNSGSCKYDGKKIISFPLQGNKDANIIKIHFNKDNSFFILATQRDAKTPGNQVKIVLYFFKDQQSQPQIFPDMAFLKMIKADLFVTGSINQLFRIQLKNRQLSFFPLTHPKIEKGRFLYWLSDNRFLALKKNFVLEYTTNGHQWSIKKEFSVKKFALLADWTVIKNLFINNDELFIATANGLVYIDSENREYFYKAENGLGTNYIRSIFKDKHGNIFICTYGAGIKVWPAGYLAEFKINGKVTSIFHSDNETYLTTTKSIYKYDLAEKRISEFETPTTSNYTTIFKQRNTIYLGTLNRFFKFPADQLYKLSDPDISKYAYDANTGTSGFVPHRNNMLISTYGDGIYILNEKNKKIDTLNDQSTPPASMIIESLVPLGTSVASLTYDSGLTIYDSANRPITLTRQNGLLSNTVYSVFKENENATWIGTKNGLNLFNGKNIIKTYSANEGLMGTNVLCIFKDKADRLWILSDKYLHLVDAQKLRAVRSHPLQFDEKNSINRAAYCKNSNTVFIGLTDALLTVDVSKIILDTIVTIPRLSAVTRDNIPLSYSSNALSFSSPASNISFHFTNTFHSFIQKFDLYYKLQGFDDNWKLLSNTNQTIYPKLTAGRYQLLAKTINRDGYSSPEISLLAFEILPPLWKRTWFILMLSILLFAAFFYIGQVLSKNRYKQKLHHFQEEYRLQSERERIARELHDNVGSQLTYLINKIDDDYPKLAEKNEAEKLSSFARSTMRELRETIWALDKREVLWEDLENKIKQLIPLYKTAKHRIDLEWQINGMRTQPLNSLEALNIYRIIQEALNNAGKYSHANQVKISAYPYKNGICVEISDNGSGFVKEKTENGYGLKNMKKRAEEMNADLQIETAPDQGTNVKLILTQNQPFS
jgi:signal transduction histidine kinase